jgi:hypothetical protein
MILLTIVLIWLSQGAQPVITPQPTMAACQDAAAAVRLIGYFDGTLTLAECREIPKGK